VIVGMGIFDGLNILMLESFKVLGVWKIGI
jgi:hypothetical protein